MAQERNHFKYDKNIKFKPKTTPRSVSSKRNELIKAISISHHIDLHSSPVVFPDDSPRANELFERKFPEFKSNEINLEEEPSKLEEESRKLEVSRSLNNSPTNDVLDSLVRFEGDSEDIDKKNTITVNPNIDLKLLFFDELHPDWMK